MINFFEKTYNKAELAEEVFEFNTSGKYSNEVKRIIKEYTKTGEEYPDRQDMFLKAIDIIGEPNNEKELRIVAKAYLFSRYPFKLKGIEYGKEYLSGNLCKEEYLKWVVPLNVEENLEVRKKIEINYFLELIAKVYESEYKFSEALKCYYKMIEIAPFFSGGYIGASKNLVKIGNMDEAMQLLKDARKNKYYKPFSTKIYKWEKDIKNNDFKMSIEKEIEDIKKKIDKGYKYKPRPSKCTFKHDYYENLSDLQKKYLNEYIDNGLVTIN